MRDTSSFDEFYLATRARTAQYLHAALGDFGDAVDATQEAYERAWRDWSKVHQMADPEAWVRTVAWRIGSNRLRHLRVASRRGRWRQDLTAVEPELDSVYLVSAMKKLTADQRQVIALHYLVDLSVEHIARQLGVSQSTVKSRLARGRTSLFAILNAPVETHNA